MSLNFNHWPPVASHLAALLFGYAVANLSLNNPSKDIDLPLRMAVVALPGDKGRISSGERVVQVHGDKSICRLRDQHYTVLGAGNKIYLSTTFAGVCQLAKNQSWHWLAESHAKSLPRCTNVGSITYGDIGAESH